jgi:protein-disulfide isomerase
MRTIMSLLAAASATALLLAAPASAASLDDGQKAEVEKIVREYLLANPEILREMSANLEAKERAAEETARASSLKENAAQLFKAGDDPVAGNAGGDVTVVEFMDYNCGYCKKAVGEIAALVEADKNVRVVFKELPIIGGEDSEYAARAAIAAVRQGKYWDLHRALFAHMGHVDKTVTLSIAKDVGIDTGQLEKDMEDPSVAKIISSNMALAQSLQLNGTPAFIVDEKVVPGYVPQSELQAAIAAVRSNGGCKYC